LTFLDVHLTIPIGEIFSFYEQANLSFSLELDFLLKFANISHGLKLNLEHFWETIRGFKKFLKTDLTKSSGVS
jgi:hypothetical protein